MDANDVTLFLPKPKILPKHFVQFEDAIHLVGKHLHGGSWTGLEVAAGAENDDQWRLRVDHHVNQLPISESAKRALFLELTTMDHEERLGATLYWLRQHFFSGSIVTLLIDAEGQERIVASKWWGSDQAENTLLSGIIDFVTASGRVQEVHPVVHLPALRAELGSTTTSEDATRDNKTDSNSNVSADPKSNVRRATKQDVNDWLQARPPDWKATLPRYQRAHSEFQEDTGLRIRRDRDLQNRGRLNFQDCYQAVFPRSQKQGPRSKS